MKKENRKLAQEKRAKARKKEKVMRIVRIAAIPFGCAVALGLLVWLLLWSSSQKADDTSTSTPTTQQSATDTEKKEPVLSKDTSLTVKDGDTVNIDYVGSIDGVEFAGGNTQGMGADLTIGSHTYIDDFEEQLIGHKVGEEVDVIVTFPENYGKEDLNGKEALFKVVINGIYE
jgi:trigger factor